MPLLERIQKDMVDAMKSKHEARLSAIRMIKTALKKVEVDSMKPLDEPGDEEKGRRDQCRHDQAGDGDQPWARAERPRLQHWDRRSLAVFRRSHNLRCSTAQAPTLATAKDRRS